MADDFFPEWLFSCIIDDAEFAAAYSAVSDVHRSWLKTNIARHQALYGFPESTCVVKKSNLRQGGSVEIRSVPLDWCVVVVSDGYASGPRFLAALMPALFSGVQAVAVVHPAGGTLESSVLVACELAGVEVVVSLVPEQLQELLQQCSAKGRGAVLTLGATCDACVDAIYARQPEVVLWKEPAYPSLLAGDHADTALLAWAHPDKDFVSASDALPGSLLAVCDVSDDAFSGVPVRIGAGQEGLFCWPDLQKDFFFVRSVVFEA